MALASLDRLVAKKKNQKALMEALQVEFKKDPVGFFKCLIMPLLPKESKGTLDHDGIVEWKTLVEAFPKPGATAAPPGEDGLCPPG